MAKSETIKIQVGEEIIELTGADKESRVYKIKRRYN